MMILIKKLLKEEIITTIVRRQMNSDSFSTTVSDDLNVNRQQNLPVTTQYPEMVAEILRYFKHNHLPEFSKENLWFFKNTGTIKWI